MSLLETFALYDCLGVYLQHLSYVKSHYSHSLSISHLKSLYIFHFVCYGKGSLL